MQSLLVQNEYCMYAMKSRYVNTTIVHVDKCTTAVYP